MSNRVFSHTPLRTFLYLISTTLFTINATSSQVAMLLGLVPSVMPLALACSRLAWAHWLAGSLALRAIQSSIIRSNHACSSVNSGSGSSSLTVQRSTLLIRRFSAVLETAPSRLW